jgi:hypothetical protein
MRSLFRNLVPLLLATGLAVPILLTGCQSQEPPQDNVYIQWEHETHRQHVDVNKRSVEERKQYQDWLDSHRDHH